MKYDPERLELTLHQSDINNYMNCPEQFRVVHDLGGEKPPDADWEPIRVETDAATVGTVLHTVIEQDLSGTDLGTSKKAVQFGRETFRNILSEYSLADVEYRRESFGTDEKAIAALDLLVESWFFSEEREYWHQRKPDSFELEKSLEVTFPITRPYERQGATLASMGVRLEAVPSRAIAFYHDHAV